MKQMKRKVPSVQSGNLVMIEDVTHLFKEARALEIEIEDKIIKDYHVEEEDFSKLSFERVIFENCRFLGCDFERADFSDVVFKGCDFSNSVFNEAFFHTCEFRNSKGMGIKFAGANMQHIGFIDTSLRYGNFDRCKLKLVDFEEVDLSNGFFIETKLEKVQLQKVKLVQTGFDKTPLRDIDFTNSTLEGLQVQVDTLCGAIVTQTQALDFAKLMGLIVT